MKKRIKSFIFDKPIETAIAISLIIASLTVGNYIGSFGKQTEIDEYKELVEEFEQRVVNVTQYSDSLQLQQEILNQELDSLRVEREEVQNEADRYRNVNTRLSARLDSLRNNIQNIDLDSIPEPVLEYISGLETQIDTLSAEVDALNSIINVHVSELMVWEDKFNLEKQRADSLQLVINTFPTDVPDPDRLFGIIKLPSRTTSFVVGAAVGVIGGISVAK